MHFITFSSLLLIFRLLSSLRKVSAATTVGPLAPVSIYKLPTYSSARPCAAGCLVHNGIWVCGVNGGYHDLGKDLGCGCGPNNACFCSAGLASSASSYISSCVSASCSSVGNVEGDLTSMLNLYDGYCQTANVEISTSVPSTTTTEGASEDTGSATATTGKGATSFPASAAATATTATTQGVAETEQKEGEGLSKSDIIALATGLGVGIPSLLVGAWALFLQLRKKKSKSPATSILGTPSQAGSQIQMLHLNRPQPQTMHLAHQPVHEMGNERNRR